MPRKNRKKRNPCRSLLVIDDSKIREESAADAKKVLRKLERLEAKLASFSEVDQRLYEEWYQKAFGPSLREKETKTKELETLREFHFEVKAIARHRKIPLSGAYRWALEEKRLLESGDENTRGEIKKIQRERQLFLWDEEDKEDERLREEARLREERRRKRWQKRYQGSEWQQWNEDNAEVFAENIERAMAEFQEEESKDGEKAQQEAAEHPIENEMIEEENCRFSPEDEERLKLLYRQLARLIHPDLRRERNDGRMDPWQLELWTKAQENLQCRNLWGMRECLRMAQFRLNQLSNLTVAELRATRSKLESDLFYVNALSRRKRRLPAWNFSRKKLSPSMVYKLTHQLRYECSILDIYLSSLKTEHKRLDDESRKT